MYKCVVTGKVIGPNVPANKVILKIRPVKYTRILIVGDRFLGESQGWEILKEGFVSPAGMRKVPSLETLLAGLKEQKPIERITYIAKRPGRRKKFFKKKDHRITSGRLKIIKQG